MSNVFVLERNEYKRDINILRTYVSDCATYLSRMTGQAYESARAFVITQLKPGGQFEYKDPKAKYLIRGDNGDRALEETTILNYINSSIRDSEIISPTLTVYLPVSVKKSLYTDFMDANIAGRGKAKKEMYAAEEAKDGLLYIIKDLEQGGKKTSNNSVSGGNCSESTPLFNPTTHSSLTSMCRITSGFANANNEKFLAGNRHYRTFDVTVNNIISIINHTDYALLGKALETYGIRHPTEQETYDCITRSTIHYFRDRRLNDKLREIVQTLTPIERSAFVYTGDLYHLMLLNEPVVRRYIDRSSMMVLHDAEIVDPLKTIKSQPEDNVNLAKSICEVYTRGKKVGDPVEKGGVSPEGVMAVAATVLNIRNVCDEYALMIRALWVTENVPASLAYFPDSIRRVVLASDTDSTIFTVKDWVQWHTGALCFDPVSNGIAATMIWLAAQTVCHLLARMSANIGVEEKRLFQISMKNEFKFDVFVPTQVGKHYYASIGCQEGLLKATQKKEIKGVHLKSSNSPAPVIAAAETMMLEIMDTIMRGEKISIARELKNVGDMERKVMSSIKSGDSDFFRRAQIKTPDSYKKGPEQSNFLQYLLWEEVFAAKYGNAQYPPYSVVKLSVDLKSPAKLALWLAALPDREFAQRVSDWMVKYNRNKLTTIYLPTQSVSSHGIPAELEEPATFRLMVADTCNVFYLILESLGIYMTNKKRTRLVSDLY